MKRTLSVIAFVGVFATAMSMATFGAVFNAKYSPKAGGTIASAKCGLCHASAAGGKLNPYGKDLKGAMAGSKKLTAAHLAAVESKDSDGDGKNNGAEIKADSLPGK